MVEWPRRVSKSDPTSEIQSRYLERSIMCDMHKEEERCYACVSEKERERPWDETERDRVGVQYRESVRQRKKNVTTLYVGCVRHIMHKKTHGIWIPKKVSKIRIQPKVDSNFWTGDHSISKSYIKGIQCSFRFWTYNILPPILSSLHISFMCSQSISTLIKLIEKRINIQQHSINIVRFVRTPRFVFK